MNPAVAVGGPLAIGLILLAQPAHAIGTAPPPRQVFLFYADGIAPLPPGVVCGGATIPPAYRCSFGEGQGIEGCKIRVQRFLDDWYRDFNVRFTLTPPSQGTFDTVVVTSAGAWCGASTSIRGEAAFACDGVSSGVAYAFDCADSAHQCASVIAQEQAHLVGLEHTASYRDLLNASGCGSCSGFEDAVDPLSGPGQCGRLTQNSHQMMIDRLGRRPQHGGPISPFPCLDKTPPQIRLPRTFLETDGHGVTVVAADIQDDCGVVKAEFVAGENSQLLFEPPWVWAIPARRGSVPFTIVVRDGAGNQASVQDVVTLDSAQEPAVGCSLGATAPPCPLGTVLTLFVLGASAGRRSGVRVAGTAPSSRPGSPPGNR
ncbi:MAG TPA: hypothetical protein VNO55_04180 [Polyangia bacterium]|nr:hypothetical protein [Polyangia bacterium]